MWRYTPRAWLSVVSSWLPVCLVSVRGNHAFWLTLKRWYLYDLYVRCNYCAYRSLLRNRVPAVGDWCRCTSETSSISCHGVLSIPQQNTPPPATSLRIVQPSASDIIACIACWYCYALLCENCDTTMVIADDVVADATGVELCALLDVNMRIVVNN